MARKRITESDLLDDRVRAAELSRAVESKYEELDRLKREQPAPVRRMGVLLLPDAAEGRDALRSLVRTRNGRREGLARPHSDSQSGFRRPEKRERWWSLFLCALALPHVLSLFFVTKENKR